jgi:dolichol-phosphate mannosyltransferase
MIFFLIPVFNEKDNIEKLFLELKTVHPTEELFFVFSDDGSTDGTQKIIDSKFSSLPHIVLGDGTNRGPGAAFNAGFLWILNNTRSGEDIVVTIEADCTSDLSILPEMLMLSKIKYDLVLASVYAQGGGFEKTTFFRRLISTIANFIFRFLFNVQVLTLSSFYRVYRISLLQKLQQKYKHEIIKEKGYVSMLEILLKSILLKSKVIEVPMELHSSKRIGKSKMKIIKTTFDYIKFLIKSRHYN